MGSNYYADCKESGGLNMNEVLALKDEILALMSESATAKDFEKLNMYLQILVNIEQVQNLSTVRDLYANISSKLDVNELQKMMKDIDLSKFNA